jgi:hypothetical protein
MAVHCEYMAKIQYFPNMFKMSQDSSMYSQCTCHVFLISQARYIVKMLQYILNEPIRKVLVKLGQYIADGLRMSQFGMWRSHDLVHCKEHSE